MDSIARWVLLALLALALAWGLRRLLRVADPDASLYARPPASP